MEGEKGFGNREDKESLESGLFMTKAAYLKSDLHCRCGFYSVVNAAKLVKKDVEEIAAP